MIKGNKIKKNKLTLSYKVYAFLIILFIVGKSGSADAVGNRIFNLSNNDPVLKKLVDKKILTRKDLREINKRQKRQKEKHSLNLSTRLQFLYSYKSFEEKAVIEDLSEFNIRRLRLQADGNMYKNVDYKFEFSADKLADVSLKDAWVGFKHIPYARIRIGHFKTPFSRQRITSSSKLQIVERSTVQVLNPGRDIGIEVSGKNISDIFDYAIAGLTGVGDKRKFADTDNKMFWTDGRVAFHPLGSIKHSEGDVDNNMNFKFEIAGNFLYAPDQLAFGEKSSDDIFKTVSKYGVTDLESVPSGDTINLGPELTLVFNGFSLTGEAYWAQYNPKTDELHKRTTLRRDLKTMGYFIQGGAFIIPKTLELAVRFEALDIDTDQQDDEDDLQAYTGGINYFVNEKHDFKLQANFIREIRDGMHNMNSNTVLINAQIKY